jgi:N-acyl-D-amino-acid deacylase
VKRRTFLRTTSSTFLGALVSPTLARGDDGNEISESFDAEMQAFMEPRRIPGGALAVVKNGRLVYAKGYGLADREDHSLVGNESLFRIASISKPITAVAVLQLVESGRLSLDSCPFEMLGFDLGKAADARLEKITISHLLHHTGGWDRGKAFDPMFRPLQIAKALDVPPPAKADAVIRYMFDQKLQSDPGSAYAYSNFGYCILGRVIEKVTGEPYEKFVREKVLAKAGIQEMRIGATLRSGRAPNEVSYYTASESKGQNVFDEAGPKVPSVYGGFHLEAMDAHGGWIASATDLVRFAAALDDPAHSPVLRPESFQMLYAPPAPPVSRESNGSLAARYYGCGWDVRPVGPEGHANYWHTGSLPGTATLLVRRHDGLSWAVCFNQRSEDDKLPDSAIDPALHRAANRVKSWPEGTALLT